MSKMKKDFTSKSYDSYSLNDSQRWLCRHHHYLAAAASGPGRALHRVKPWSFGVQIKQITPG